MIGAALGAVAILLAMKMFSKAEFGLQQSLNRNTSLAIYFIIMGFDYTLLVMGQRYHRDHPKRGAFLRFSLFLPLLCFLVSVIPFILFRDWIIAHVEDDHKYLIEKYYYAYPLITLFYLIYYWLNGYVRSIEKATFVFFVNEILLRLLLVGLLLSFLLGWIDFTDYVWMFSFSFVFPILIVLRKAWKDRGFSFRVKEPLTKEEKTKIFDFAFFHMMIIFTGVLAFQIDGYLFPSLSNQGLENIAVYSTCIYAVSVLRTPLRVLGQNAIPTLTHYYDEGDLPKLRDLYKRSSLNVQILSCFLCLLLLLNMHNIQELANFWKQGYESISILIPILLLGVFIELACGLNFEILGVSRHYRVSFYLATGYLLLIVILFYFLVRSYGLTGAAWAFSLSMMAFSIARSVVVGRLFQMSPLSRDSFRILSVSILCGFIYFLPSIGHPIPDLILRSAMVSIIFIACCYYGKIGEDVPRLVNFILKKLNLIKG